MMKKVFQFFAAFIFAFAALVLYLPQVTSAAFNGNDIIDDAIFDNASSMSAGQIDNWLNSNFGSTSCISTSHGFTAPDPTGYNPSQGFLYGGNVSAGQVIYDAAQAYGLNPEVILVTLQKEQSLVSGNAGCSVLRYTGAMGYGCPDGGTTYNYSGVNLYTISGSTVTAVNGTCVNTAAKAGFSEQIIHGTWLLKFGEQRSKGNTAWNVQKPGWDNSDDPQTCYGGPMTQGSFKRCSTDSSATFYDGYTTIDGQSVHMDSGATAALYWYTPHFSGNQNFDSIFSGWFGSPTSPCTATSNILSTPSGSKVMSYQYRDGLTNLAYTQQNNTGSACAEVHLWNPGYQSWLTHIATAMRASNPSIGTLVSYKPPGSSHSQMLYIVYSGGGGLAEVHKFSPDFQTFPGYYDVATNLSGVSASSGMFIAGDFLHKGYDQLAYILYSGSGGHLEIHLFNPSLTSAIGYYDVATNLVGVSANTGTFAAGDFFGRGYDQLAYIVYSGGGGLAEVHVFNPSLTSSTMYEVPVNLGGVSATSGTFVTGNFLGTNADQLAYILYNGGSGMVEVHTFSPSLRQAVGYQDIATNFPGFDPTK